MDVDGLFYREYYALLVFIILIRIGAPHKRTDGEWGEWSSWLNTGTNPSCGSFIAEQQRTRSCESPASRECLGVSDETRTLQQNQQRCPDGAWGDWSSWQIENSATCGPIASYRLRNRSCDAPAPSYSGHECYGDSQQNETLQDNLQPCPVDGAWGDWSSWQIENSATCGPITSYRLRNRSCNAPAPSYSGSECYGDSQQNETLQDNLQPCPLDGAWGHWSLWQTENSATCGPITIYQLRNRSCDAPAPSYGGSECYGDSQQNEMLQDNLQPCPVNGTWGDWSSWQLTYVSATCGAITTYLVRKRSCDSPAPRYGGSGCYGESYQKDTLLQNLQLPCPIECYFPPEILNAHRTDDKTSYDNGTIVKYSCDIGYEAKRGDFRFVCTSNGTWFGEARVCEAITCGEPSSGYNSYYVGNSYKLNRTVRYFCHNSYTPYHGNYSRTCAASGVWTGSPLICRISVVPMMPSRHLGNIQEAPGAAVFGTVSMIVMLAIVGFIVLLDMNALRRELKKMCRNLSRLKRRCDNKLKTKTTTGKESDVQKVRRIDVLENTNSRPPTATA